jgi:serine protease Do
MIFITFLCVSCDSIAVNEIHNRSINYGEITINDLNTLTTTIVTKTRDSVIGVTNYRRNAFTGYQISGTGSGVIYECTAILQNGSRVDDCMSTMDSNNVKTYEYLAVTNRHVIDKSHKIKVYIGQDDAIIPAEVIKADPKVDLAVIKFNYIRPIQPVEFADSDLVSPGNIAIAIGNPYGHEFWGSATFGIISSPKRYMSDDTDGDGTNDWDNEYIQHDVAINPGNSGGALLNAEGKLIGINTLKFVGEDTDGMGFSIPSNVVKEVISYLEKGQVPVRLTLGIGFYAVKYLINPDEYPIEDASRYIVPEGISYGIYIINLANDNKYNKQFRINDIILEVNGKKINYSFDIRSELDYIQNGEKITFLVLRDNQEVTIEIQY